MDNESILEIDELGSIFWRNKSDRLHRLDGPAVEYSDGTKEWYCNGVLHRLDGPAHEDIYGTKQWYKNGRRFKNKDTFFRSLNKEEKEIALFSSDFLNAFF